ncbi:hypothetical protein SAMD00019534_028000, partial [Acytostelium subglobosum LB1]|uniref:hypothetical protein n=1 Tax=Acytostelium subglobosum LB1 TaxID=1410327 RepID=UPI000644A230
INNSIIIIIISIELIMTVTKKNVGVIVGSTRTHRVGLSVTNWFIETSKIRDLFNVELIDLKEWNLPFMDEEPPMMLNGQYSSEIGKKWSAKISSMDCFIVVSPEYNRGYPAPLKNAIDYLYSEWIGKPLIIATYGFSGGKSSNEQLSTILGQLKMQLTETHPMLFLSKTMFDDKGAIASFKEFDKHIDDIQKAVSEFAALNVDRPAQP